MRNKIIYQMMTAQVSLAKGSHWCEKSVVKQQQLDKNVGLVFQLSNNTLLTLVGVKKQRANLRDKSVTVLPRIVTAILV